MELFLDVGHRPIIIIRFDPDDYIHKDMKVTPYWAVNKLGICMIKKKNKRVDWSIRITQKSNRLLVQSK